jgi:putative ABC transport system permease protein
VITPDYFRAMGIPILMGRPFTGADKSDSPKVAIIDERLAREFWPNEDPLGKRIRFGPPENNEPWHTIVGVVGAVQHERLEGTVRKTVYLAHAQNPIGGMSLAVRSNVPPETLAPAIQSQVKEMDPDLPVTRVRTMNDVIIESVWQPRLYAMLFGVFGVLALVLAAVGIYGVMAYSVTQRTREIGVRVALGATTRNVVTMVVGEGLKMTVVGLAVGLAGAFMLTRVMASLLFEVSATDPLTFALVGITLTIVALVACFVPARRAAKVDPMVALRYE